MPNLPPETIANYLRVGPGPTSMGRAACQWRVLRAEIIDLESRFNHMLLSLTAQWSGPIATQVIEAAKALLRWLNDLSVKLFEIKEQIFRIICAYLNAYHTVVPTARINANRTR
ncbi:PPE family protein, partial [Mycobacterium haemophilum DSM 44634]